MKDYGLVSIITPTWACASFIGQTIKSIRAQTYQNWELLIQDDCSVDGTDKIVKPYTDMDARIKYESNLRNSGAAVTRNNALKRAKGRWIAFLDSDDLWMPEKLAHQLKFMVDIDYHFSYTGVEIVNEKGISTNKYATGPRHIGRICMLGYCWIGSPSVMYDAEKVGLIQIADIKKNNDYAIWLKVIKKTDCYLLDEILAQYRVRQGSISRVSYLTLIKWHYRMFREAENFDPFSSVILTLNNL